MNNYTILVKPFPEKGVPPQSFHIYEREADSVKSTLKQIKNGDKLKENDTEITGMKNGNYQVLDVEPLENAGAN